MIPNARHARVSDRRRERVEGLGDDRAHVCGLTTPSARVRASDGGGSRQARRKELERPVPARAMSALFAGATLGFSVAWLIEAGEHVTGQIALIWLMAQVLSGVVGGAVDVDRFAGWLAATTLGNILGGTVIVGVANYGQVRAGGG
jgi:formate/nitrite transporter FocA (FNT family)